MSHMRQLPKVSIILPTYNRASLIGRAVRSVLDQTYRDFELIIVDDCSDDDTKARLAGFDDKRIRCVYLSEHKGAACARNAGIKTAGGKFIAFADSDDRWVRDKLEKQVNVLEDAPKDLGVVYTAVHMIDGNKKTVFPDRSCGKRRSGNIYDNLLFGNFVTIHSLLRKEILVEAGGFDEDLPRLQDWDLWLRLSAACKFFYINQVLAEVYKTEDAISRDEDLYADALEIILKKNHAGYRRFPALLAKNYYVLGRLFAQKSESEKSRSYIKMARNIKPFNLKYLGFEIARKLKNKNGSI